jgi:hypothetical protein
MKGNPFSGVAIGFASYRPAFYDFAEEIFFDRDFVNDGKHVRGYLFAVFPVIREVFEYSDHPGLLGSDLESDFFVQFANERVYMFFSMLDSSSRKIVRTLERSSRFFSQGNFVP